MIKSKYERADLVHLSAQSNVKVKRQLAEEEDMADSVRAGAKEFG